LHYPNVLYIAVSRSNENPSIRKGAIATQMDAFILTRGKMKTDRDQRLIASDGSTRNREASKTRVIKRENHRVSPPLTRAIDPRSSVAAKNKHPPQNPSFLYPPSEPRFRKALSSPLSLSLPLSLSIFFRVALLSLINLCAQLPLCGRYGKNSRRKEFALP